MIDAVAWQHFHFLRPWWLLACIPFVWSLWHMQHAQAASKKWQQVIAPHLLKAMLVRQHHSQWFNPIHTAYVLTLLATLAMAGPSWQQQPSPFSEDLKPLVIMLDASESMQQSDVQPSRLERAMQKIEDLLALRPGGMVGLVAYAGSAHSVIPLTNDSDIVKNFLNAISPSMMPVRGKFPEKALPVAEQMLRHTTVPGTILMVGDGISPDSDSAFQAYFSSHPQQLLILGVGQESMVADEAEGDVIPLERRALERLAANSKGYYQSLTLDKSDVQQLNRRIHAHLVVSDKEHALWLDMGYYLLFPIMLVMLLCFRRGWTLHWCIMLCATLLLSAPHSIMANEASPTVSMSNATHSDSDISFKLIHGFLSLWLSPDQLGMFYLYRQQYQKAAASFDDIAWRGVAYYRAENFKAAVEMFSRIQTADGYFNLGNAYAHARHYLLAVKSYDHALQLAPAHAGARKNREKVQAIIDEINQLSASQQAEEGDSTRELGDDEPQTADGAERKDAKQRKSTPLTADELLMDEALNELWMRQVQKDPSRFLSAKFHMQLQHQGGSPGAP